MVVAAPLLAEKRQYRFDGFVVDPVRRLVLRDGKLVPVTPKAFSILLILLERQGEVVDKDELLRRIWPNTFVTEANLTQNVSALRKALGERAHEHRYILTVPGRGYSFVGETAEAPAVALPETTELEVASEVPAPSLRRERSRLPWSWLAALLLLAAVTALLLPLRASLPGRFSGGVAPGPGRRPSIAVLGFRDLSGSPGSRWLAPALAEMLTTELAAGGHVRVVSTENVARVQQLAQAGSLEPEPLRQLHGILGCDLLVVGSYLVLEGNRGQIRLDLRVLQLPEGDTAASVVEVGAEPELFDLVARTGARLREALGFVGPSPEQARRARALLPANPESARLYAEGLQKLHAYDTPAAVDLLHRAAAADPRSASIHSALAQAWAALGYDARAVEEARKAFALSDGLPRPERLAIEARNYEADHQWSRASEIYRSLWMFYPDDLEFGLQLAWTLVQSGRATEALATIAELRRLPPPTGLDPRIDLAEAVVDLRSSDIPGVLRAARAAAAKGRASGESMIVAQASVLEGGALLIAGKPQEAIRLFQHARALSEERGYAWGTAMALAYAGLALHKQGDLAGAERAYSDSLAVAQGIGNVSGIAMQLGNLGLLYQSRGDLSRALDYLERSRARFAEIEEPQLESRVLNASASILLVQGELDQARSRMEEVLALSRKAGSRIDEARVSYNLANVLVWKGEVREAARLAQGAVQVLEERQDPAQTASALSAWADASARLGDIAGARRRYEEALALKKQAGDRIGIAQILGSLAYLDFRTGDPPGARARSEEQMRIARETGARPLLSWSLQGVARAGMAAGSLREARKSIAEALGQSSAAGEQLRAMGLRIDLARLALAEGDAGEAARLAGEDSVWWREHGNVWGEAHAVTIHAEALARQGRSAEALAAAARAHALLAGAEDRDLAVTLAPGLARAEALAGQAGAALRPLAATADEARRSGFVAADLDARLTLGVLELQQGSPSGRIRIEEVRREAEARGFGLLARQAKEALAAPPAPLG